MRIHLLLSMVLICSLAQAASAGALDDLKRRLAEAGIDAASAKPAIGSEIVRALAQSDHERTYCQQANELIPALHAGVRPLTGKGQAAMIHYAAQDRLPKAEAALRQAEARERLQIEAAKMAGEGNAAVAEVLRQARAASLKARRTRDESLARAAVTALMLDEQGLVSETQGRLRFNVVSGVDYETVWSNPMSGLNGCYSSWSGRTLPYL